MRMLLLQVDVIPNEFWGLVLNQGFSVALLVAAVWWFNKKNTNQEKTINDLYMQMVNDEKEDNKVLIEIIREHTQVLKELNQTINHVATVFESYLK